MPVFILPSRLNHRNIPSDRSLSPRPGVKRPRHHKTCAFWMTGTTVRHHERKNHLSAPELDSAIRLALLQLCPSDQLVDPSVPSRVGVVAARKIYVPPPMRIAAGPEAADIVVRRMRGRQGYSVLEQDQRRAAISIGSHSPKRPRAKAKPRIRHHAPQSARRPSAEKGTRPG